MRFGERPLDVLGGSAIRALVRQPNPMGCSLKNGPASRATERQKLGRELPVRFSEQGPIKQTRVAAAAIVALQSSRWLCAGDTR
jgi:hypothetical protein